ncbi:uncharacterized protein LOC142225118 [Haematobia irritans]|uniref:uncharacterized protein LOC142225118 n=1 Tax=Haematobia irritans TaxID=7368 RepID=UPI003F50B75C
MTVLDDFTAYADELVKFEEYLNRIDRKEYLEDDWILERQELMKKWERCENAYKVCIVGKYKLDGNDALSAVNKQENNHQCYIRCNRIINQAIKNLGVSTVTTENKKVSNVSVPPCDTGIFYGDYVSWPTFRDLFVAIYINNANLSPVEKLYHLLKKTEGEAREINRNVPMTDEGFRIAWENLRSQYENKRILVNSQLKILFNLPIISQETAPNLKRLQREINNCISVLQLYDIKTESWDPIFVFLCSTRLPKHTLTLWEQSVKDKTSLPKWEDFNSFLTERFLALESVADLINLSTKSTDRQTTKVPNPPPLNRFKSHHTKVDLQKCHLCHESHSIRSCSQFLNMDVKNRSKLVKKFKLCLNCLSPGHLVPNCKSSNTCSTCRLKHHSLLHREYDDNPKPTSSEARINPNQQAHASHVTQIQPSTMNIQSTTTNTSDSERVQTHATSVGKKVVLATAWVNINHLDVSYKARVLIDPCSDDSFITESLQKRLKLPTKPISAEIVGVGGMVITKSEKLATFSISSINRPQLQINAEALVVKEVTGKIPTYSFTPPQMENLPHLELADPQFFQSNPIEILLGGDLYPTIVQEGIQHGVFGSLIAQKTIFGWILTGPAPNSNTFRETRLSHFTQVSINEQLEKFWKLEEISPQPILSEDDKECEKIYASTTKRLENGRYMVQLPFKRICSTTLRVGSSRHIALTQFLRNEKSLNRSPEYKKLYEEVIDDYLSQNHMEPVDVPVNSDNPPHFYLPHHGIFKPHRTTTKLRVVFNASCTSSNGYSLNDLLYTGPTLQADISCLILKWRFPQFVFNADISQMYRQILIHPDHTSYQRLLFRKSSEEYIQDFQLKTVTFGLNCAPFLALRTLHQLATDEEENYPLGAKVLLNDMYVDDVLTGAHTLKETLETKNQLRNILNSAGFQLRKWTANSPDILSDLPREHLLNESFVCLDDNSTTKTLGVRWNASVDSFFFVSEKFPKKSSYTKREVLSIIARLFDPAGWLAPVVVKAKIFMQQLWLDDLAWDDYLKPQSLCEWQQFIYTYNDLDSITIPRWVHYSPECDVSFHGFCDSSELAYSATIYVRIYMDNEIFVHLLVAKTKVAPIKKQSLPRLELCGAVLLAELVNSSIPKFNIKKYYLFLWTDSTIVLAWLKKPPCTWTTFVANRVSIILQKVGNKCWAHVDTHHNPADLATRGLTPSELKDNRLWWNGPTWLHEKNFIWPSCPNDIETTEEKKNIKVYFTRSSEKVDILTRFSSLNRAIRVLAFIFRFYNNSHPSYRHNITYTSCNLEYHEIKTARNRLFHLSQKLSFSEEYWCLSQNKPIPAHSSIISLNPYLDDRKIIRANGRLAAATCMSHNERHPIILAYNSRLSRLYVEFVHKITFHGGHRLMLNIIRRECWILKLKNLIKTVIYNCKVCMIHRRKLQTQIMAQLPIERVTISRPFVNTGVDFAGPFDVKSFAGRCCRTTKGYVCIFICFATKAIHLEMTSDLTTSCFLAAFSRFISRRGCPNKVYSDNGRNFLGAARELERNFKQHIITLKDNVVSHYGHQNLSWHFIPASAPHMGGLWEAGVKSFKSHLKKTSGQIRYTFEEFCTLLASIEACLNSRPLCSMSNNIEDLSPLTPAHFLIGSTLLSPAEPEEISLNYSLLSRWRKVKAMNQEFCRRWKTEYLHELQKRNKWKTPQKDVQPNDLVIIHKDFTCPTEWQLGRVIETVRGSDDRVRVAIVKTQSGTLTRPIHKLVVLPLDAPDSKN